MSRRRGWVVIAGFVILASGGGAHAVTDPRGPDAPPRTWTQVTDASDTRNIDEIGLARTDDGVLHLFWRDRVRPLHEEIHHRTIATDGSLGGTNTASGPVSSAGNPAAIVTADGGLRIFFAGLTDSASALDGVLSASADERGATWTTDATRVSSTTSAIPEGVGAALAPDGTPTFAYAYSFVLGFHFGLDPATADVDLIGGNGCCAYQPNVAFNDDEGVVAWYSNVEGQVGYYVQTVYPEVGVAAAAPDGAVDGKAVTPNQRTPLVTRAGSGEIYLAYCSGYPSCTEVLVWEVGAAAPMEVAEGADIEKVNLASDPDGRLWVVWQDVASGELYAARSDEDASEFGAPSVFEPTDDTTTVWHLAGSATDGQLDVIASLTTDDGIDGWHTAVLPGLGVEAKRTQKRVTFTVTDAGDPVKGAEITFKGEQLTTDAKGRATGRSGKGRATVTRSGYSEATTTVT
jgi:hypothetical protein